MRHDPSSSQPADDWGAEPGADHPPPKNAEVEYWGAEPAPHHRVTERDRFHFAKQIVVGASIVYTVVAITCLCIDVSLLPDVWATTKDVLVGTVAGAVGYCIGKP